MNRLGLWMQWTTHGCGYNKQLRVVDVMNKIGDCGLQLQVKPLKGDQVEGD